MLLAIGFTRNNGAVGIFAAPTGLEGGEHLRFELSTLKLGKNHRGTETQRGSKRFAEA